MLNEKDILQIKALLAVIALVIFWFMVSFSNHMDALRQTITDSANCIKVDGVINLGKKQ